MARLADPMKGELVFVRCWSCNKVISDSAKMCAHCEARVPAATDPERATPDPLEVGGPLPTEIQAELRRALEESASGDDFVNQIMTGDCPKCGGSKTSDCEDAPGLDDPALGRCFDCGTMGCLECGGARDELGAKCACWSTPTRAWNVLPPRRGWFGRSDPWPADWGAAPLSAGTARPPRERRPVSCLPNGFVSSEKRF